MCMSDGSGGRMKNLSGTLKVKLTPKTNTETVIFEFGDKSKYRNIDRFCEKYIAQNWNRNWNWEEVEE